jgi:hypothetical protein
MIKKPQIFGILFVIAVFALVSTALKSQNMSTQSLVDKITAEWQTSGHADTESEVFRHWDEDDPAEIPTNCAKCHSTYGFQDFIVDGVVDNAVSQLDSTVECEVCHTDPNGGILRNHTSVKFPSGITVENLGPEALCMECHQGRESTSTVDAYIEEKEIVGEDTVSSTISFRNIHYYAAAANQFGTLVQGGYQYEDKVYDARFSHVDGYNACYTCHNPHSLEVRLDNCATCHTDPQNQTYWGGIDDPRNIRFIGSFVDYDGDGNMEEGMFYEIQGVRDTLYAYIQFYAKEVAGTPIGYDLANLTYPYFFIDTDGNGVIDPDEAVYANSYKAWTPRLIKAAYNFQCSLKDPGGYAHGGKYLIEIMYDSVESLSEMVSGPPEVENLNRGGSFLARRRASMADAQSVGGIHREDEGHFNGGSEAWRHWDEDGEVESDCAKCHSATGLAYFLQTGLDQEGAHLPNGMLCTTCHTTPPSLLAAGPVTFPSGAVIDLGDSSNLCMNCHQGRESKVSLDNKINGSAGPYSFTNIHYYPVGAIMFGTEAQGGYEFAGKSYAGRRYWPNHNNQFDTCVQCHMGSDSPRQKESGDFSDHNVVTPNPADCVYCHGQDVSQPHPGANPAQFKFSGIRPASTPDYDGDGNISEPLADEIKSLEMALYAQIQDYGFSVLGVTVAYDTNSYPYFFGDTNGNGVVDPAEATRTNGFTKFDAPLLRAAFNFHASKKEPHAYIHNSRYIAQLLVDSIEHLGGNIAVYSWR